MKLSDASVGEFRALWKEHFGEELTEEIAREYAESVLELGEIVYEPYLRARERGPP